MEGKMKTGDIIKILLKATTLGLVSTSAIVGTVGTVSSISNAFTNIPNDEPHCLDDYQNLRRVSSKEVLLSLLGFVPGFLFGALYFLNKQPGLWHANASEYDIIEDGNENSFSKDTLDFLKSLVSINTPFEALYKGIIAGLVILGVIYGPASLSLGELDIYEVDNCPNHLRAEIIFKLILCLMILAVVTGPILAGGCWSTCTEKNEPSAASSVRSPLIRDDDLSLNL